MNRPRLRTLVPLIGLVGLVLVAALALRSRPPLAKTYPTAPPEDAHVGPDLELGVETLAGVLTDELGMPVAGATLVTQRAGRALWCETDERGRFSLEGLDPGPVELAIVHDEFGALELDTRAGQGPVLLRIGPRLTAPPELEPIATADFDGHVRLRGTRSLAGFELALDPVAAADEPGAGLPRRVRLTADGTFAIPALPHGTYEVRLLPPWARGGSWPNLLAPLDAEPLRWDHPPPGLDGASLELDSLAGEVAGRVFSADDDRPLAGAMITVQPVGDDETPHTPDRRIPSTRTNAEGLFRVLDLPPGRYRVELVAGGDRRAKVVRVPEQGPVDPEL